MNASRTQVPHNQQTATQILPLENGDRLSQIEFERRYTAMPKVKKAELIEGVGYIASPGVSFARTRSIYRASV